MDGRVLISLALMVTALQTLALVQASALFPILPAAMGFQLLQYSPILCYLMLLPEPSHMPKGVSGGFGVRLPND